MGSGSSKRENEREDPTLRRRTDSARPGPEWQLESYYFDDVAGVGNYRWTLAREVLRTYRLEYTHVRHAEHPLHAQWCHDMCPAHGSKAEPVENYAHD